MAVIETSAHVRQAIQNTFANRFTCKRYDPEAQVSQEDFDLLLDVARRSPSSFGLEPWKILAIEDTTLLNELLAVSWGAKKNANRTVVLLARKDVTAQNPYTRQIMTRVQGSTEEEAAKRLEVFDAFQTNDLDVKDNPRAVFDWASKQCYIAMANMLTAAAMMGIDSTPIEGFNPPAVDAILAQRGLMDPEEFGACLMVQFGGKAASHFEPHQTRRDFDEVVQVVTA